MLDEEQKKIEKILKELANLQVKACVLSSQNIKCQEMREPAEVQSMAEETEQIGAEFTEITRKLAKKLGSPAIEKTLSKLETTSFNNPGLAQFYLAQLIHEMKGVAEKAKETLNIGKIEAQYKTQLEQKKLEAEAKKLTAFEVENQKPIVQLGSEALAYQMI